METDSKQKIRVGMLNEQYIASLKWDATVAMLRSNDMRAMHALIEQNTDLDENTVEWMHPMCLGAQVNLDTPTWEQAMNGPDEKGYKMACATELETLRRMNAWEVVDRKPWMHVIPSTWAFKCKRYPDGLVRKLKARFCARGDRQVEGVDSS